MELVSQASGIRYEIAEGEHTVGRGPWLQARRWIHESKHKNPCYYGKVGGAKLVPLCKDVWQNLSHGDNHLACSITTWFSRRQSPCGETATDPGGKSPCGETSTDPGGKSPCGETSTDPGGKSPCGETATDPGGKSPCGETATDPGGKSPCGETATDPGGKSPCGETATDPGGKSPCERLLLIQEARVHVERPATDPGGKSPCGETATDPGGKSPCAQPSHDCTAIYAEEPCKPTQPVDRSIDMCVRQHSTSKPRALPSWLTDIEVESKPPKKKAKKKPGTGKKAGGQSQESGDKPKAKSHEEKPHPPAKVPYPPAEVADLTVDRATIPEAVPKEIKGVDRVTKPGPGSMESTAGPGSMESTAGPGSMESTAATKPPSSLPVCPYGDKCYRKNPAHFREFSHTAATPSGGPADEKPECPYGSKRQSVKRPNKRSVLEGDSDEDDQPNTYDYTDSFIDDEQEGDDSSSYGEEDDDMDWVPDNDSEDVADSVRLLRGKMVCLHSAITVPRSEASGVVNNKKETFSFKFSHVFDQDSRQEDIFENVAKGVIDNCLQGYNGTIFAYGQTGSGKTFTITGGAERYNDRGIIPRAISYLFQQYEKTAGVIHSTHISYLELYNESGYDLLDPKHEGAKLEDLPRATMFEDGEGNVHLKNLSLHSVNSEEEALNWLFMGDTNRMIAETPMNMASTRSHCIFTIHLSSREPGSDVIRKAKLHLVDLAGSERVGKTGVVGTLLTEAKYINLSLHYLEQVIVALSERSRTHIPYRNSMLTSVLRDRKLSPLADFAQRVALIKNEAVQNENWIQSTPLSVPRCLWKMVERLKQQVQQLKEELTLATGEQRADQLSQEDQDKCHELVQVYVKDRSLEAQLLAEALKRQATPTAEPNLAEDKESDSIGGVTRNVEGVARDVGGVARDVGGVANDKELQRLRDLLKQRDEEIMTLTEVPDVLLKMLKQEKRRAAEGEVALKEAGLPPLRSISPILGRTSPHAMNLLPSPRSEEQANNCTAMKTSSQPAVRQEALDLFMREYANTIAMDAHKKALKAKEIIVTGLTGSTSGLGLAEDISTEENLKQKIEEQKASPSAAGNGLGTTNQSLSTSQGLGTSTLPSGRASACHSDTDQLSRSSSSINASSVPLPSLPGRSVPLTGDTKADADILAFYRARQKLIQRSAHLPSSHH
eukprot:Em0019g587a